MLEGEELLAAAAREANHGRVLAAVAVLDAARALLSRELPPGSDALDGIRGLDPGAAAPDAATVLETVAGLQDALDAWRGAPPPAPSARTVAAAG